MPKSDHGFLKKLKKQAFTLVEMMIIVTIISVLAVIAIPNILKARLSANDVRAQATLKTISTALENYIAINGIYPDSTDVLSTVTPPYIKRNYFVGTHAGFTFSVDDLSGYSYAIDAFPVKIGSSGTTTYTITTGGVFIDSE